MKIYSKHILKFEKITIGVILLFGLIISTTQLLYNRSLWLDEAMLALNIVNRGFIGLLSPLSYYQVAPILFIEIEKLFSIILPNSEIGLRFFPFLSYNISLYFFYRITKMVLKNKASIIFALSLIVFNTIIIYYSSEVKQYMCDVLMINALYFFAIKPYDTINSRYFAIGSVGVIGIFLSNITPIVFLSILLFLLFSQVKLNDYNFRSLFIMAFVWAFVFLIYYLFFIYAHPAKDFMLKFWSRENAFMPINFFGDDFLEFIKLKYTVISYHIFQLGKITNIIFVILFIAGIISLIKNKNLGLLLLTLLPILIHLILSALKLYPFDMRLILYTVVPLLIIVSLGFDFIFSLIFDLLKTETLKYFALLIPILFLTKFYNNEFPIKREEIKNTLDYINQHLDKNDKIYVYHGTQAAFDYYTKTLYFNPSNTIIRGSKKNKNEKKFRSELLNLKNKNWLLYTHVYRNDEKYTICLLDSLGIKRIDMFKTFGSSAYLYDFGQRKIISSE